MTSYEIPLSSEQQFFRISLLGVTYGITLKWQQTDDVSGWYIDVADQNSNLLVGSIPLVTGVDLLHQYKYLGIGGGLYCYTDGDDTAVPTYDNIGTDSHLNFVTS